MSGLERLWPFRFFRHATIIVRLRVQRVDAPCDRPELVATGENQETEGRGLKEAVNLEEKFGQLPDYWQPRVVAEVNDYQFKIVRVKGEFVWHDHADTDEAFFVLEGTLRIDLPDGAVEIGPGELYVVPRGVRHRPVAEEEVKLIVVEPRGVVNTGDERGDLTAESDVWI